MRLLLRELPSQVYSTKVNREEAQRSGEALDLLLRIVFQLVSFLFQQVWELLLHWEEAVEEVQTPGRKQPPSWGMVSKNN